jgi:predicted GTPase
VVRKKQIVKTWRTVLLLLLLVVPLVVYGAVGGWALWQTGHLRWLWWLLPVCWALAFLLARHWRREMVPRPEPEVQDVPHWTDTDQRAANVIVARQQAAGDVDPQELADPQFYLQTAMELSLEIARQYHPQAEDPVESLTIPEILAAARLALEDVEKWTHQYVPASHLLTVRQWRRLSKAPRWLKTVSDASWVASMLFRLGNVGRYAVWKVAMEPVTRKMHSDILAAFYVFFVRQTGFYLIEMNSGRLRGGADPYREMMLRTGGPQGTATAAASAVETPVGATGEGAGDVTIALMGQINAGKSSLINAMLGQRVAVTDVLPQTDQVQRYSVRLSDTDQRIVFLDTPGYSDVSLSRSLREQTLRAIEQADLVLLVMNASNPARQADHQMLDETLASVAAQSHRKPPPVIGVLTHIDALAPQLEWDPPYNWQTPTHLKEENIRGAVDYGGELLGDRVQAIVPICSDVQRQREYGIVEWLEPAIAACLEEARACAFLRLLHAETNQAKLRQVFHQLAAAGRAMLDISSTGNASPPAASG